MILNKKREILFFVVFINFFIGNQIWADEIESLLEISSATNPAQSQNLTADQLAAKDFAMQTQSYLGTNINSDQSLFIQSLANQEWSVALIRYQLAFSSFSANDFSESLKAYLYFKTGLQLKGLETLFKVSDPQKIPAYLLTQIKSVLPSGNQPLWKLNPITWSASWSQVIGPEKSIQIKLAQLSSPFQTQSLISLRAEVLEGTQEAFKLDWLIAQSATLTDQNQLAATKMAQLLKQKKHFLPLDQLYMSAARILFQSGSMNGALVYYQKIQKSSDLWILAQEEMAWTYLKMGHPSKALAIGKTLTYSGFLGWATPEAYLVTAIAALKVCDYNQVNAILTQFSKYYKVKYQKLNTIVQAGGRLNAFSPLVAKSVNQLKTKSITDKLTVNQIGAALHELPLALWSDHKYQSFFVYADQLLAQEQMAQQLYTQSLAVTGLQKEFDQISKQTQMVKHKVENLLDQRIVELAKLEQNQIEQVLSKMHIVEAEVLSHVTLAQKLVQKGQPSLATQINSAKNQNQKDTNANMALTFKSDSELWFDELGQYKVDVTKGCQAKPKESQ